MDPLPTFLLFPDPTKERVIEPSADKCDICNRKRGSLYTGPQYSTSDDVNISPWCIADGSAAARDITFNDSIIFPAFDSTPQMTAEDKHLVECLTPGFTTWQGNHWLMCCGRACIYLGEAAAADLQGRWRSAVPSMFDGERDTPAEIDEIIATVRKGQSPCAYVFQCQACKSLRAYWECD